MVRRFAIAVYWTALFLSAHCFAQSIGISLAWTVQVPTRVDGNSPSFWRDGKYNYITSTGLPVIIGGDDQFGLAGPQYIALDGPDRYPMWIESIWPDDDGTLYGWYHHEPTGVCPGDKLTAPKIGAVVSYDGGRTFRDLGIVLESGDPVDCTAQNEFFAGGHGDFSVVLDREGKYFYFYFTNYGGDLGGQGIVAARMAFDDRKNPQDSVWKYFEGGWNEPGIGGRVTPVFGAQASWQSAESDSFWGPAIHWNTFLEKYVILLNHACCKPGWPQEGIYATFNADLSKPEEWSTPKLILQDTGIVPGYYPQAVGLGPGETDTLVGERARLYVQGVSSWELVFSRE